MKKVNSPLTLCLLLLSTMGSAQSIVRDTYSKTAFPLVYKNLAADLYVDRNDFEVVKIAAKNFREDVQKVTGILPSMVERSGDAGKNIVIMGSVGRCKLLSDLSEAQKIDIGDLRGQWETFKIFTLENPLPGIKKALIIAGSDRRGTAFGVYELSRQMGVSPWYFWADVMPDKKENIFIPSGETIFGPPDVKYRGMFINDSKFGLNKWAAQKMDPGVGGLGLNTYREVFELMLRLKSNYIWSAGNIELAGLADEYAIVLGTPHNQQMHASGWDRESMGEWDYSQNGEKIYDFWNNSIKERKDFENVYTVGMRDLHDLPMQGDLSMDEKVMMLEKIIDDQQEILGNNINSPVEKIPQAFVPYKEVLDLYNQGLKLPEDVIIVWPDDNYGYIKRLPSPSEQARSGGSGVYYHLSYLGRPHDYLWLSSHHPVHVWEEMKKAYDFNARDLWVFNVGDIKPAEYSFSFAMDLAWDVSAFNRNNIKTHLETWMGEIYGDRYKKELGEIMYTYYQLAFQRKPEYMGWDRLEPTTPVVDAEFSWIHYREAERRLNTSRKMKERAAAIQKTLPENQKASFYQLVYYPVACTFFTDAKLLLAQKNRLYAKQERASTNHYAELAAAYWDSIKIATLDYHNLLDGKWKDVIQWDGIGINIPNYWLRPTEDDTLFIENCPNYFMPPVETNNPQEESKMEIFAEGFDSKTMVDGQYKLPWFNSVNPQEYFFEIYNKGLNPFPFEISSSHEWIKFSKTKGLCESDVRIQVSIDYTLLEESGNKENHQGSIKITGTGGMEFINVFAFAPGESVRSKIRGKYIEDNGSISFPAEGFHRKKEGKLAGWEITRDLGVTGNCIGSYPFAAEPVEHEWSMEEDAAIAEYDFYCFNSGWVDIYSMNLPTHPINSQRHCLYGISIDDSPPLIIDFQTKWRSEKWKQNVQRNRAVEKTRHFISTPGLHTLKIWMIDTGVFVDKVLIDFGGLKDSYLGPKETLVK